MNKLITLFGKAGFQLVLNLALAIISMALMVRALLDVISLSCVDPAGVVWGATSGCFSWPMDSLPLIVAVGFWVIGMILAQRQGFSINVLFFFLGSIMLSSGLISALALDWAIRLFYITMAWLSPVLLRFHLEWLDWPLERRETISLRLVSGLAILWTIPFAFFNTGTLFQNGWLDFIRLGVRLTLFLSLLVMLFLLIVSYRNRSRLSARPRIRLAVFGSIFGLAPLVLLYFIPNMFGRVEILATYYLPFLILIPLSYGYSILRIRPSKNDRLVFQLAVFYLIMLLTGSLYIIVNEQVREVFPAFYTQWESIRWLVIGVLGIGMLLLRGPLSDLMDWVLYGPRTLNFRLLERFTESLAFIQDRKELWSRMGEELVNMLPISGIALFLRAGELLHCEGQRGFMEGDCNLPSIAIDGALANRLMEIQSGMLSLEMLLDNLDRSEGSIEAVLNTLPQQSIAIPLMAGNDLLGMLLIGSKPGGEFFREEEKRLLSILGHQSGIAVHNVQLMEDLRTRQRELEQAYYRLTVSHEDEQRRLARELHDDALQDLLSTRYRIQGMQRGLENSGTNPDVSRYQDSLYAAQEDILSVISGLRGLIGELRPAGLEDLGLVAALQGYLMHMESELGEGAPCLSFDLDDTVKDEDPALAICLFRAAQEGLRNALHHSKANQVTITLKKTDTMLRLDLQDDGIGFTLPEKISQLANNHHYGLLGIEERVRGVKGRFTLRSTPGKGTHLIVEVPIAYTKSTGEIEE